MAVKKIDPWLLETISDAAGFPNKPYDLTQVKGSQHLSMDQLIPVGQTHIFQIR